ncbi:hypothetical protein BG000_004102 [Podila horticola]|nr:hypothetical protein BG000_004102 [Podila horticola]
MAIGFDFEDLVSAEKRTQFPYKWSGRLLLKNSCIEVPQPPSPSVSESVRHPNISSDQEQFIVTRKQLKRDWILTKYSLIQGSHSHAPTLFDTASSSWESRICGRASSAPLAKTPIFTIERQTSIH